MSGLNQSLTHCPVFGVHRRSLCVSGFYIRECHTIFSGPSDCKLAIRTTIMNATIMQALSWGVSFNILKAMCNVPLVIPYYHVVSDREIPHLLHLYSYKNLKHFNEDLDFLLKNYIPIDLLEVLQSNKNYDRFKKNSFILAFDDGFREIYEVIAPVLRQKGIPAVFFLCSAFIDNKQLCFEHKASLLSTVIEKQVSESARFSISKLYFENESGGSNILQAVLHTCYSKQYLLDEAAKLVEFDFDEYLSRERPYLTSIEIKDLIKTGFFVGSHSIDHPRYIELSDEEKLYQTVESVRIIRQQFNLEYGVFAFPHSDANISLSLLAKIHGSGIVNATFGNQGMLKESFPNHMQRFSLEKHQKSAREIIKMNYCRRIYKNAIGQAVVKRLGSSLS
jgi:peptidoglycan/xylan/chitin deacetylase (PgdA/CDA1 family)